jgi:membrane-bound inhibitor of C-type lysozyme
MTRLRSMSGLTLLLGLSLAAPVSGDDLGTDGPKLDTLAWDCEGPRVVSKSESREVLWLFLPDRTLEMPLVPSASGAKYQKDGVLFWTKAGDQALLELHGQVVGVQQHDGGPVLLGQMCCPLQDGGGVLGEVDRDQ